MSEPQKTKNGHYHVEAFMLMHYACVSRRDDPQPGCGHHEVIWNSRDGVTPFTTTCPSCGKSMGLVHVNWHQDEYAPNHKLHYGQKYWISLTKERAMQIAQARVLHMAATNEHFTAKQLEDLAESFYDGGIQPDLAVACYVHDTRPQALAEL